MATEIFENIILTLTSPYESENLTEDGCILYPD